MTRISGHKGNGFPRAGRVVIKAVDPVGARPSHVFMVKTLVLT